MNERFARAGVIARIELTHEPDFILGSLMVRPSLREIAGPEWTETIDPRVMQVLVALARAKGRAVSREDLIESCWDGLIVGEDAINRCIGRLRKVAEASGNGFSIETVPRVGYRLRVMESESVPEVVSAVVLEPPSGSPASAKTAGPQTIRAVRDRPQARSSRRLAIVLAVVALAVVVAAGSGFWRFWPATAVQSTTAPVEVSVAVLPFLNMSGDPKQEYFSDGFSEELINDLSSDPHLLVTARSSAFAFKGRNVGTQSVARALHVSMIVEGSVREAGNRVRITTQLIDAHKGFNIWSASYDRNLSDVLALQSEVAHAITIALTHRLLPRRVSKSAAIDPTVYRLFLQGRAQLDLVSQAGYTNAYVLLKQVVTKAPDFADGLAAFSRAAWSASTYGSLQYNSMASEAKEAATKALALDSRNVEAGEMRALFEADDWNWSAASADFRALRAESPNQMRVLVGLANYFEQMGFWDQALLAVRRAQALDPLSDGPRRLMMRPLRRTQRFGELIDLSREILARSPDDPWALDDLCLGYAFTDRVAQARQLLEHLRRLDASGGQRCTYMIALNAGDLAGARAILETWIAEFPDRFSSAQEIAEGYVATGDFDKASDWYKRAYERRENFFSDTYASVGRNNIDGRYHQTSQWKVLTNLPAFKAWQAAHDRIAVALAAHRDPLSLP